MSQTNPARQIGKSWAETPSPLHDTSKGHALVASTSGKWFCHTLDPSIERSHPSRHWSFIVLSYNNVTMYGWRCWTGMHPDSYSQYVLAFRLLSNHSNCIMLYPYLIGTSWPLTKWIKPKPKETSESNHISVDAFVLLVGSPIHTTEVCQRIPPHKTPKQLLFPSYLAAQCRSDLSSEPWSRMQDLNTCCNVPLSSLYLFRSLPYVCFGKVGFFLSNPACDQILHSRGSRLQGCWPPRVSHLCGRRSNTSTEKTKRSEKFEDARSENIWKPSGPQNALNDEFSSKVSVVAKRHVCTCRKWSQDA